MIKGITTSNRELTVTTWEHGEYRLIRTVETGEGESVWSVKVADWKLPSIHEQSTDWMNPQAVTYGVNWSAIGTVAADEARDYAAKIVAAAEAAEAFNEVRNNEGAK